MTYKAVHSGRSRWIRGGSVVTTACLVLAGTICAQTPAPPPTTVVQGPIGRDAAVQLALHNNPALMVVRQQNGFGEAAILISKTYPFNPVYTGYVTSANGPAAAGVTNQVYNEHYISLELELRGQGGYRRAGACATATKIEWEIAYQEMLVSMNVLRAYNAVIYRQAKIGIFEENYKLNEQLFEKTRQAADQGKVKLTDLTMARADLDTLRAQRSQIRTALAIARSDLRRQLGVLDDSFGLLGSLDVPMPALDVDALTQMAIDQRPDLRARRAALCEAENALKLVEANRFGNPSIGPYYEYDPTRVTYWGARISAPIPVFNTRKGEILKAQTEVCKVRAELNQLEVQASLDVRAALARLADATQWAASYDNDVVPALFKAKQDVERTVVNRDPGADPAKLVAVQKAFLKAQDSQLDAHFEVSQGEVDLALAIAEPTIAIGPMQTEPPMGAPPAPAAPKTPLAQAPSASSPPAHATLEYQAAPAPPAGQAPIPHTPLPPMELPTPQSSSPGARFGSPDFGG
jgi:cobalt-zinc-cadmium efflux system outer membrane protein